MEGASKGAPFLFFGARWKPITLPIVPAVPVWGNGWPFGCCCITITFVVADASMHYRRHPPFIHRYAAAQTSVDIAVSLADAALVQPWHAGAPYPLWESRDAGIRLLGPGEESTPGARKA